MVDPSDDVTLTFGGNATTLLRIGGFTLLTDPNFLHRGQRAYLGKGLWTKRLTEPALQPTQLPTLDSILLSHLHADHWDRIATRTLDRGTPVITTQAAARALGRRGFRETVAMLLPPVMGSVLELVRDGEVSWRGYISGDTVFRPELGEVLERCGPLDVVIAHLGGTRALGFTVTMDGRQGADLVELLKPPVTVPVHYGDFVREVAARRAPGEIRAVTRGETISLRSSGPRPRPGAVPELS